MDICTYIKWMIKKINCPFFLPRVTGEFISFGNEFGNSKFLVIQSTDKCVGLFSIFITTLGWIRWAIANEMIPVVDMQSYANMYQRRAWPFRENAWEHFFEQPGGVGLNEIKRARSVMFVRDILDESSRPNQGVEFFKNEGGVLDEFRKIVTRYIRIKDSALMRQYTNKQFDEALSGSRVLGILARGTDYASKKPKNHPVVPNADMLVHDAKELIRQGRFDKVYLVTEDESFVSCFKEKIPHDRLILALQSTIKYAKGSWIWENKSAFGNVAQGCGYLKAILDLSRCSGILAARTSGAVGAAVFSHGFEYEKWYDLGYYM